MIILIPVAFILLLVVAGEIVNRVRDRQEREAHDDRVEAITPKSEWCLITDPQVEPSDHCRVVDVGRCVRYQQLSGHIVYASVRTFLEMYEPIVEFRRKAYLAGIEPKIATTFPGGNFPEWKNNGQS